jgi:pimeloyl-ACP methyl ester carboxylesterase
VIGPLTIEHLALALLLLPLLVVAAVTFGVWATQRAARSLERGVGRDEAQARAFGAAPAGALARAAGSAVEGVCQTAAFGLQGLHAVVRLRLAPPRAGGGPPVLLVAGYLENAGLMWPLARRLAARGFQPVLVDLPSTLRPIAENAAFVATRAREVAAATGYERVGYVAHSMGGVIGRAAALADPEVPLATVVSIASPHRGTRLARFGIGLSAVDMCVESPHCAAHAPGRCARVPVHTVISPQDNIVSPAWSTVLGEGEDVVLARQVGHVAPLFLPEVAAQVIAWLEAADYRPAPAAALAGGTVQLQDA